MVGVLVRPASVVRWLTETNLTQTEMSDAVPVPAGCWWYLVLSSSHAGSPGFLSAPKKVVITDTFLFSKWKLEPGHKYARKVLGYHCCIPCPFSVLRQDPGLELGDSAKAFWVTEIAGTCHYTWL